MDIIKRNFYRILRQQAFGEDIETEPMSAFKWEKLRQLATEKNVGCYMNPPLPSTEIDTEEPMLPNFLLNHKLEKIRYREMHAIDTSADALNLLNLIIYNTNQILSHGLSLRGIIELGRFLRTKGDKVDYIKLETWLGKLYLQQMAKIQCSYLIRHFGFETSEMPFITSEIKKPSALAIGALHFINLCSRRLAEIEE